MQQLTLQFDGYADSRPVIDAGTAKRCKKAEDRSHVGNVVFPYWEKIIPTLGIKSALREAKSSLILSAQAAFCMAFGFGMMFLAALIGG